MQKSVDPFGQRPVIGSEQGERSLSESEAAVASVLSAEPFSAVLQEQGALVEDILLRDSGAHRRLQVLVDRADPSAGPLDLDTLAEISRSVSEAVDTVAELGDEPFELEVSTPGVSRPLTRLRHFQRNLGRWINVVRHGGDRAEGRLNEVRDESIVLQGVKPAPKGVTPKPAEPVVIEFAEIAEAAVDVEFSAREGRSEVEEA